LISSPFIFSGTILEATNTTIEQLQNKKHRKGVGLKIRKKMDLNSLHFNLRIQTIQPLLQIHLYFFETHLSILFPKGDKSTYYQAICVFFPRDDLFTKLRQII
jgi:hypothetical protein